MEVIKVNLSELKLLEKNVRMHPKRQIEEYKRSLIMFGQTKNAVIDEDNNVLIGNGLVIAATELGWDEIGVIRRTDFSENDKLKLMVSDNKIFGLGIDNLDAIDNIFQQLSGDLNIPGYDEDTLKSMVAEADAVTEELMQYGRLNESQINSIQNRPAATITPSVQPINNQAERMDGQTLEINNNDINNKNENNGENNGLIKCPKCGELININKELICGE